MRRTRLRKPKPPQTKSTPFSKVIARTGVSSVEQEDGFFPGKSSDVGVRILYGPRQSASVAISEDASLKEQYYDNDSLGG